MSQALPKEAFNRQMNESHLPNDVNESEIAIIGMSCRFPGAKDVDAFWQNLQDGVESVSFFSDEELVSAGVDPVLLENPNYVRARAVLPDIELFDAPFFGFNPREVEVMDPQHRLFLEEAWKAIEHAGYDTETYEGSIGIYAGKDMNSYLLNNLYPNLDLSEPVSDYLVRIGNRSDNLPMRVSYKLNLKGPSVNVQTTCSTSLVAVHLACQSLLDHECDIALAGGVSINVPQRAGYAHQEGMILSPDGHCRAFDARAKGTVSGNGVGIVVLKRLADAIFDRDCIYGIIKGSAINNDGSLKVGYTAPSIDGQAKVISEAQAIAEVEAKTITYIEAHGTGTVIGDPIEISALTQAFRASTQKKGFCALGSVKTNVGHLDAAAGVAGLIKTVLALNYKLLPPSLHFEHPNPKIDFANSPFYVNATLSKWNTDGIPRRAGVSSFGIGGTNAHIVLEEALPRQPSGPSRPGQLLVLSAKTDLALDTAAANLARHLQQHPDSNLADVAYTLQTGRRAFSHRRMLVCQNLDEAVNMLNTLDPKRVLTNFQEPGERPVAFMFPGQGAQYVNMGLELYQTEPAFRGQVDLCSELLKPLMGLDLRHVLYPSQKQTEEAAQQLRQTAIAQPALFVMEYALAKLWMEWGVHPQAMIGHSVGEYVAACLSGLFSLADALTILTARAQLMQQLPGGAMLTVQLSETELQPLLGQDLSLAAINAPSLCVISGPTDAVEALQNRLADKGVESLRLHTSHGFHSKMMEPILEEFTGRFKEVTLNSPQIPCVSTVTGDWLTAAEAIEPGYWARNLRQTVRFADGIQHLLKEPTQILLEVGPGRTLSTLAKQHPDSLAEQVTLSSLRHPQEQQSDVLFLLMTLGRLWLAGVQVDWPGFCAHEQRHHLPLPTYPFERQRYWIEAREQANGVRAPRVSPAKKPDIADWFYIPSWKRSTLLGSNQTSEILKTSRAYSWLVFLDAWGLGFQLAEQLKQNDQDVITVKVGAEFTKLNDLEYTLNPQLAEDYDTLLNELRVLNKNPNMIVHLWSVTENDHPESETERLDKAQDAGFYSLLFLAQALGKQNITHNLQLTVISNNVQEVTGEDLLCPEKATVLGPVKIIPQEYPNIRCRSIDVVLPESVGVPPANGGRVPRKFIDQLLMELLTKSSETVIAYRGNHRWAQSFEPIRLEESIKETACLRESGVYLITGGLGNIGFVLAEHLAKTVRAKLVLTGRSAFPAREEWQQWLDAHDKRNGVSRKILKVQKLEELGVEVLVARGDVANQQQMQKVITQAENRFGQINGVIHAAGITGEKSFRAIEETGKTECERQFQPKVYGLFVLEQILRERELDFCILLSSLSSVLGGLGFVAYSAANLFMDAFVQQHNQQSRIPWINMNWDGWQLGEGKKQSASVGANLAELAITPEEGIMAFQRVLSWGDVNQVVVSTRDLQTRIDQWIKFETLQERDDFKKKELSSFHSRSGLDKAYPAPRNSVEEVLADIWADVLGLDQVGVHDNFFELGGHSLQAIQLVSKMSAAMNRNLSVNIILSYPTIAALAGALKSQPATGSEDSSNKIYSKPKEHTDSTAPYTNSPLPPPTLLKIERRPLLSLFAIGEIGPIDSAALYYLPRASFTHGKLTLDRFNNLPACTNIVETFLGRIAKICLPCFDSELYTDEKSLVNVIIKALKMAKYLGAHTVSLTGLIPSATNYGHAVTLDIAGRQDLPAVTTGHATTAATVVLTIKRILEESGRDLTQERVGVLGLGSIGAATLRLMLKCLPHPPEIILCDLYSKLKAMERIKQEIVDNLGFRGAVRIVKSQNKVPSEFYKASLMIGATNVPDLLDIARLEPGTLIVDDSSPHCFKSELTIRRFEEQEDILFTEGGVLKSPHSISEIRYVPKEAAPGTNSSELESFLENSRHNPFTIFGCVFSSLLSSRFENLRPTVGFVDVETSLQRYEKLNQLGFQAADLHCGGYILAKETIRNFRGRFGQ